MVKGAPAWVLIMGIDHGAPAVEFNGDDCRGNMMGIDGLISFWGY